jgi:hypothetical protein
MHVTNCFVETELTLMMLVPVLVVRNQLESALQNPRLRKSEKQEMDVAQGAVVGGAAGVGVVAGAQAVAGLLVPWAMSTFGTVVAGVGTITTAGGVVATLQTVSMVATPVGWAVGAGAVAGVVVSKFVL